MSPLDAPKEYSHPFYTILSKNWLKSNSEFCGGGKTLAGLGKGGKELFSEAEGE
jgi:hypothetical protein